jgi:hypothetical protein
MLLLPAARRRKYSCPVKFEKEATVASRKGDKTSVIDSVAAVAVKLAGRRLSWEEGRRVNHGVVNCDVGRKWSNGVGRQESEVVGSKGSNGVGQLKDIMRKVSGGRRSDDRPSEQLAQARPRKNPSITQNSANVNKKHRANSDQTVPVINDSVLASEVSENTSTVVRRPPSIKVNAAAKTGINRAVKQVLSASIKQKTSVSGIKSDICTVKIKNDARKVNMPRASIKNVKSTPLLQSICPLNRTTLKKESKEQPDTAVASSLSPAVGSSPPLGDSFSLGDGSFPPAVGSISITVSDLSYVTEYQSSVGSVSPSVSSVSPPAVGSISPAVGSEPVRKCGSASSLDSGIVSPSTESG